MEITHGGVWSDRCAATAGYVVLYAIDLGAFCVAVIVAGEYGGDAVLCEDGMDAFEPVFCGVFIKAFAVPEGFMEEDKGKAGVAVRGEVGFEPFDLFVVYAAKKLVVVVKAF